MESQKDKDDEGEKKRETMKRKSKGEESSEETQPFKVKILPGAAVEHVTFLPLKIEQKTLNPEPSSSTSEVLTRKRRAELKAEWTAIKKAKVKEWTEQAPLKDTEQTKKFIFTHSKPSESEKIEELEEDILKILTSPGGNALSIITTQSGNYLIDPGALNTSDFDLYFEEATAGPMFTPHVSLHEDENEYLRNYSKHKLEWEVQKTKYVNYSKSYIDSLSSNLKSNQFKAVILTSVDLDNFSWLTNFFPAKKDERKFTVESIIVNGSPHLFSPTLISLLDYLQKNYSTKIFFLSCKHEIRSLNSEYLSNLDIAPQANFIGFHRGVPVYKNASTLVDYQLPCANYLYLEDIGISLFFPIINHHHGLVWNDCFSAPTDKEPNADATVLVVTIHARMDPVIDYHRHNFSVMLLGDSTSNLQNRIIDAWNKILVDLDIDFLVTSHNGTDLKKYVSRLLLDKMRPSNLIVPTFGQYSLPTENFCNELLELTSLASSETPHRVKLFKSAAVAQYKEVKAHLFTLFVPLYLTFVKNTCYLHQPCIPMEEESASEVGGE